VTGNLMPRAKNGAVAIANGVPAREGENLVAVLVGEPGVGEAQNALARRHERAADRLDAHRAGSGRANDTLHEMQSHTGARGRKGSRRLSPYSAEPSRDRIQSVAQGLDLGRLDRRDRRDLDADAVVGPRSLARRLMSAVPRKRRKSGTAQPKAPLYLAMRRGETSAAVKNFLGLVKEPAQNV
jgi:hypothetical protein